MLLITHSWTGYPLVDHSMCTYFYTCDKQWNMISRSRSFLPEFLNCKIYLFYLNNKNDEKVVFWNFVFSSNSELFKT